jgi:hypothetical protein
LIFGQNYFENNVNSWNQRKLSRVLTAKAQSQSIASSTLNGFIAIKILILIPVTSDFKAEYVLSKILTSKDSRFYPRSQAKNLVIPVEALAGLNFADMEKKAIEKAEAQKKEAEAAALRANPPPPVVTTTTTTTTTVTTIGADGTKTVTTNDVTSEKPATDVASVPSEAPKDSAPAAEPATVDTPAEVKPVEPAPVPAPAPIVSPFPPAAEATSEPEASEDDTIFMGLRVYTDKSGGAATIGGQLRHEMEAAFANLGVKAK